jgi:hypothetical protein
MERNGCTCPTGGNIVRWMRRKRWKYIMERNGSVYPTGGKNGKEKCEVDDEQKMELCRKERNGSVYPTGGNKCKGKT